MPPRTRVSAFPVSRPSAAVPARPLPQAIGRALPPHQDGFSLLSIILVSALGAAVLGVAATAYLHNQRASGVAEATSTVRDINQRLLASYASAPNFAGLTTARAKQDGVFPKSVQNGSTLRNAWSGEILVNATHLSGPSGPGSDNGFVLTYEGVEADACPAFVINAGRGFHDVKVHDHSVMKGRQVDVSAAGAMCAGSGPATVQFIQAKASPQGPANPELTPCVIAPGQTQMVACPPGQISSVSPYSVNGITQTRYAFCNSAYGQMGWSPWVNAASTCAPICTPPASIQDTASQTASCAAGRVTPAGSPTFTQTETRTISYSCPAPTGPYTTNYGPYSPWTPVEAAACVPKCVAPANTTQTQGLTGTCPAGQVTGSGGTTFGQTQTRAVNYACPAPTGGYTTSYGAWSAPTPAVASVCAPKCVAPVPSAYNNYQWVTVNAGCPAGYWGSHTYQVQQVQTVTTTYSCPSPQGGYASSTSAGGWSNTGATQADNNGCTPPPPTGTYKWVYQYATEAGGESTNCNAISANQCDKLGTGSYHCESTPGGNTFLCGNGGGGQNVTSMPSCSAANANQLFGVYNNNVQWDCGQSGNTNDCSRNDYSNSTYYKCQLSP